MYNLGNINCDKKDFKEHAINNPSRRDTGTDDALIIQHIPSRHVRHNLVPLDQTSIFSVFRKMMTENAELIRSDKLKM